MLICTGPAIDGPQLGVYVWLCALVQVFGYLHTAWTEIGFTHGDLNCANVMEHRGDADLFLPRGFADKNDQKDKNQLFKLPGMLACQTAGCWQVLLSSRVIMYQLQVYAVDNVHSSGQVCLLLII